MLMSAGKQLASGTSAYHACVCGTSTFVSGGSTGTDAFSGYLKNSASSTIVGVKIVDDNGVIMYEHEPTTGRLSGIKFTGKAPFRIYASGSSAPYKRWIPRFGSSTTTDSAYGFIRNNLSSSGTIGTASAKIVKSAASLNLELVTYKNVEATGLLVSSDHTPSLVSSFNITACTYNGSPVDPIGLLCIDSGSAFNVPSGNKANISFGYSIGFTGSGSMSAAQVIRNDGGNPGADWSKDFSDLLKNAYYVDSAYRNAYSSIANSLTVPDGFSFGVGEYGQPFCVRLGENWMHTYGVHTTEITCNVP